jgi:hypothetical protein
MLDSKDYQLNDVVEMKKAHPCASKSKLFTIVRLGADIKIQCCGCGNIIMLPREVFNQKGKKIIHSTEKN